MLRDWIMRRAARTPYWHLDGYMSRYWLFGGSYRDDRATAERDWKGSRLDRWIGRWVAARVHHIHRSDDDRHLHDHPFWSISIVLQGGYYEVLPDRQGQHPHYDDLCAYSRWVSPGKIVFRRGTDRHRLLLPENQGPTVSLFIMGPKTNEWGFYTDRGKVHWREYLGLDSSGTS